MAAGIFFPVIVIVGLPIAQGTAVFACIFFTGLKCLRAIFAADTGLEVSRRGGAGSWRLLILSLGEGLLKAVCGLGSVINRVAVFALMPVLGITDFPDAFP